jgi:hypothetical protein
MTSFPNSPRLIKGGLMLLDPQTGAVERIITLQYNPDMLSRSLQIKTPPESGERSEALRLSGPPVETLKLDVEIDATDQLEFPEANPNAVQVGILPQLAALETIVYPSSTQIQRNIDLAKSGTLEITPMEAPLTLFVWSKQRVVPVRLTEVSVTEEAFDASLNPIRAKVSLGMRVLSINDLLPTHPGAGLYLAYQQGKERLARLNRAGSLAALGIGGI